jgi:hypothetical protein
MRHTYHPLARLEYIEGTKFYSNVSKTLAIDFVKEVDEAITRVRQMPHAWTPISKNCRRCLTKRFPYGIIYKVFPDHIFIVAIMHLHRDPEYWKNRI